MPIEAALYRQAISVYARSLVEVNGIEDGWIVFIRKSAL